MGSEFDLLIIASAIVAFFIAIYIYYKGPTINPKLMPTYCEACSTRVEYNYRRNGYFCPKHGKLIFLTRGIPIELIDSWYDRRFKGDS